MKHAWKWLTVTACGLGLFLAAGRVPMVQADDEGAAHSERGGDGDAMRKLDRIVEKLDRIVDRMGQGGPPRSERHLGERPGEAYGEGPRHEGPRHEGPGHEGPGHEGRPAGRPQFGGPGMPPEMREMLEQRMQEGRRRMQEGREMMEKAREKFCQLEERVKSLEAEV